MTDQSPPDLFDLFELIDVDRKEFAEEQQQEALEKAQEEAQQRAFKGNTYDPTLDFERLSNNLQRVYAVLLDGLPHTEDDLRPVGGSRWSGRVRDLRSPMWGPLVVTAVRQEGQGRSGVWIYRLDPTTVTPHIHHKIMSNSPDKDAPNVLELRRNAIRQAIRQATGNQLAQLEAVIASWGNNPDGMNVEDIVED